jgi:hypothetical protein
MAAALGDEVGAVVYTPKFREYGIPLSDGGSSKLLIDFCPFCGARLPGSTRERWFDTLDELGLEPGDDRIPAAMETDEWWSTER